MNNNNNQIKLDDALLSKLESGGQLIKYNGVTFHLIGKGGEGYVYKSDKYPGIAIKVYTIHKKDTKCLASIYREFYVVEYLRSIEKIKDHIVNIYYHQEIGDHLYSVMDLYDGDLIQWAEKGTTAGTKITDDDWLSMAFQTFYVFTDVNSRGLVHNDSKPKNVFYKKVPFSVRTYKIKGKTFNVPTNYLFCLGDFSHSRIYGIDPLYEEDQLPGSTSDPDLLKSITERVDLYETSNILNRILVNAVVNTWTKEKVEHYVDINSESNPEFESRISAVKKDILNKVPKKLFDKIWFRAQIYELLDYGGLTYEIVSKDLPKLIFPSKEVQSVMSRLIDTNQTADTLFADFMS